MGHSKTPHKPSTHTNFIYVFLGDLIKDISCQFDFGYTNNYPSKTDTTSKYKYTNESGNDAMILTNLSNKGNLYPVDIHKVLSGNNPYSTQKMKELTFDVKMHQQVNTSFIYVSNHNLQNCQPLVYRGANGIVSGENVTVLDT